MDNTNSSEKDPVIEGLKQICSNVEVLELSNETHLLNGHCLETTDSPKTVDNENKETCSNKKEENDGTFTNRNEEIHIIEEQSVAMPEGSNNLENISSSSEQAEQDLAKTPVTLLQELCVKRGFSPAYEFIEQSGEVHAPTFVMSCTASEFKATGQGKTKKQAKHDAALSVLSIILKVDKSRIKIPQILKREDVRDTQNFNPIGLLQEMALTQNLPSLKYDLESDEGPPHQKTFTISCSFKEHQTIGIGKTKKLAKREAAVKMLKLIKETDGSKDTC